MASQPNLVVAGTPSDKLLKINWCPGDGVQIDKDITSAISLLNGVEKTKTSIHHFKQCSVIVNWTLRNILQGNMYENTIVFFQENAIEKVVGKMVTMLFWPPYVKTPTQTSNYQGWF